MKNKNVISDPHDRFFKEMLSDRLKAVELLQLYGQADVVKLIDLNSLKLMPATFIDKKLKKKESDILYQAKIDGKAAYFYFLFEHQSTPDVTMPLRCARYVTSVQEQHMKQFKTKRIPCVFSMVFYNGQTSYNYPADIREMLDAPDYIKAKYRLGTFELIDLNGIDDTKLRQACWSQLCLFTMKHARDRDVNSAVGNIIKLLETIQSIVSDEEYLAGQSTLICYIMNGYRRLNEEEFMQQLKQSSSERLQQEGFTVAEQIHQRGWQQGRQEGHQEGHQEGLKQGSSTTKKSIAKIMLIKGFSVNQTCELTGLSVCQVENLHEKV